MEPLIDKETLTNEEKKEKHLSPKQRLALRLYACGFTQEEIAEQYKLTPNAVSKMVTLPESQEYMKRIQEELDEEFQRLYGLVISSIRAGLSSLDMNSRLAASALWLKSSGKESLKLKLSAEDIIQELRKGNEIPLNKNLLESPKEEDIE